MKATIPLCIFTLALNGCFTVTVSQDEKIDQKNDEILAAPLNRAPSISGVAINEIQINQAYSFIPYANDEDGDTIVFEIENKPNWGDFNSETGELSGIPTTGTTFNDIIISVKDGEFITSLNAFDITVLNPALSRVILNWQAPTEDVDGNDLHSISAYKIFYGNTQGNPDKHTTVTSGTLETYTISNLEPGSFYFTMSAVSSNGVESDVSNEYYFEITE
jgi:hypothetical protein